MSFPLAGKVAVVTGAGRGIGAAIATALSREGAGVALIGRDAARLEKQAATLSADALVAPADITDPESVHKAFAKIRERFPRIDILVNNAGTNWSAPAEDHRLDAWQKLVNLNLTGTFLVTQAVGKRSMIPNRYGKIITVASVAGLRGNPVGAMKTLAYNTTKGGLVNFTRALAGEWGEHNITVNAVAPGFFQSKMTRDFLDQVGPQVIARTPLARLGDEQDLKGIAVLLASDASRHITGQIIAVDGGSSVV